MILRQPTFFDSERTTLGDSIELTVRSLEAHGAAYDHWAIAFSGGKDSSALATLVPHLIRRGLVAPPKILTVIYADTRMEMPPLAASALSMMAQFKGEGIDTRVAVAPIDKRFLVNMLGRGVTPPTNATMRWCTRQIKVEPMEAELERIYGERGRKILMLTGVRVGESAARDDRIAVSCGKNGAECGQGWFQETMPDHLCDTLAPILHWRTCLVWDWLSGLLAEEWRHGYPTGLVAEAYGLGEEGSQIEQAARTGCTGCPLATKDRGLENLLRGSKWWYLRPLLGMRDIYTWMKLPENRVRSVGLAMTKGGEVAKKQGRLGALTMDARREAMGRVLSIQSACNDARPDGLPVVDMLNDEETARIKQLIEANTWPRGWVGDEPTGDEPYDYYYEDGSVQPWMFSDDFLSIPH